MSQVHFGTQKLLYHIPRLNKMRSGHVVNPIYAHVEPVGHSSHWCLHCNGYHLKDDGIFLDEQVFNSLVDNFAKMDVKSMQLGGKGEPFLHPQIVDIIGRAKAKKISVSVDTFCAPFDRVTMEAVLPQLSWLRLTMYAGTRDLYARLYKTSVERFDQILDSMAIAIDVKRRKKLETVIGAHAVVSEENVNTLVSYAKILKELGASYFQVKPLFLKNQASEIWEYLSPANIILVLKELQSLETPEFTVVIDASRFAKAPRRQYTSCTALPFYSEITSRGDVYTCGPHVGEAEFLCGSLKHHSFEEIWKSEQKNRAFKYCATSLDVSKCMPYCRPDEANQFLDELARPPMHVNFI